MVIGDELSRTGIAGQAEVDARTPCERVRRYDDRGLAGLQGAAPFRQAGRDGPAGPASPSSRPRCLACPDGHGTRIVTPGMGPRAHPPWHARPAPAFGGMHRHVFSRGPRLSFLEPALPSRWISGRRSPVPPACRQAASASIAHAPGRLRTGRPRRLRLCLAACQAGLPVHPDLAPKHRLETLRRALVRDGGTGWHCVRCRTKQKQCRVGLVDAGSPRIRIQPPSPASHDFGGTGRRRSMTPSPI